jgi:hypothetical protein
VSDGNKLLAPGQEDPDGLNLYRRYNTMWHVGFATESYSPITLSSAAWQHGSSMLVTMGQQKMEWPEFNNSE